MNISEASAKSNNNDNKNMGHGGRNDDSASSSKRGRSDDMPNLSSLGLNSSSISPAVLAAALNQAGLGELIHSMKRNDSSSGGGFNYSGGGYPSYSSGGSGGSRYSNESSAWKRRWNY